MDKLIADALSDVLGQKVLVDRLTPLSGGSINQTAKIDSSAGRFFVKWNKASRYPGMFVAEAHGLSMLRASETIRIPEVIGISEVEDVSFLFLEYIKNGSPLKSFFRNFGEKLARLHRISSSAFGADQSNYIGSLSQSNNNADKWSDFFIAQRLKPMVSLARKSNFLTEEHLSLFEDLYLKIPQLFPDEQPSLLHGDLWSGNFMCDSEGDPVLIDPAFYFGNREMDIAMSALFGGFSSDFYDGYNAEFPLKTGWEERIDLCNLYPLLVHLNLFGKAYLPDIVRGLKKFN